MHMTPFICNFHKSVPVNSSISYLLCVLVQGTFPIHACALPELLIPRFKAILKSFCRLQSGVCRLHWRAGTRSQNFLSHINSFSLAIVVLQEIERIPQWYTLVIRGVARNVFLIYAQSGKLKVLTTKGSISALTVVRFLWINMWNDTHLSRFYLTSRISNVLT